MITVYSTHSVTQAHLIKGLLHEHGIDAWVTGDYLQGGVGELQAIGFVQVRVESSDERRAATLIDDFERDKIDVDEEALADAALSSTPEKPNHQQRVFNEEAEFREAINNKILIYLGLAMGVLLLIFLVWS